MVGREEQLSQLQRIWQRAAAGQGQTVFERFGRPGEADPWRDRARAAAGALGDELPVDQRSRWIARTQDLAQRTDRLLRRT